MDAILMCLYFIDVVLGVTIGGGLICAVIWMIFWDKDVEPEVGHLYYLYRKDDHFGWTPTRRG